MGPFENADFVTHTHVSSQGPDYLTTFHFGLHFGWILEVFICSKTVLPKTPFTYDPKA
jgi:hypothetical protein